MRIESSLLREKFTIKEKAAKSANVAAREVHACSNRMVLNMQADGLAMESFVVRTDSMHLCARMAGHILADYENRGPFAPRMKDIKWDLIWDSVLSDYERRYNKRRWVAIYHKGKPVYVEGEHHPFLDIIEQYEVLHESDTYSVSLKKAEEAFLKAGKDVAIDYASNVALVIVMDRTGGRCSTILRSPDKTTTFHYLVKPQKETEKIVISQGFSSSSDFLEGINISYFIGLTMARLEGGNIDKYSDEANRMRHARKRLEEIGAKVNSLESRYIIRYRPERPMFDLIIAQTERHAKTHILNDPEGYI